VNNIPTVAVVTRTKNRNVLLRRALESVLGQTFDDWVMVVVNDGGVVHEVDQLLDRYKDRFNGRLKVIHHKKSRGMEAASNAGIQFVDSEYVIIHDDDDSWHPDFLKLSLKFLWKRRRNLRVKGVITYSVLVQEEIHKDAVIVRSVEPFNKWLNGKILFSRMISQNVFPPVSFLYERSVFDEIGLYNEELPVLGDWEFNLRFMSKFEIVVLPKELAYYHHRQKSLHSHYGNSVIAGQDKHVIYDSFLRNELLRQDLLNGDAGLGHLVNDYRSLESLMYDVGTISSRLTYYDGVYKDLLGSKIGRFFRWLLLKFI
jgi:glycosyltransferase involved in cell wall biosynthesis